jgi:acetyltransferase-like isoleucine patch superfamily enzyme
VIADFVIVNHGVQIGDGATIEPFVILGKSVGGITEQVIETRIGGNARIRSHTVIYAGNVIGDHFQTGHGVLLREYNKIGHRVSVGSHSIIEHHVTIGDGARIHSNCFIPEYSILEPNCWVGPCLVITNARYPQSPSAKSDLHGAYIESKARIGAGAILLPGVRIGAGALVGAGAVVTKDVAPGEVVIGNPSRVINRVENLPY